MSHYEHWHKDKEKISFFSLWWCWCCYVAIESLCQDVHTANIRYNVLVSFCRQNELDARTQKLCTVVDLPTLIFACIMLHSFFPFMVVPATTKLINTWDVSDIPRTTSHPSLLHWPEPLVVVLTKWKACSGTWLEFSASRFCLISSRAIGHCWPKTCRLWIQHWR